jgi:hypothetical protein
MAEAVKQKMNPDRFLEIFERYSFEEKGELIDKIKFAYKKHGEQVKEDLQNNLQAIELKISELENKIS